MTTSIGASQATLGPVTITNGTNEYYFTRFVSPPIFQTDVDANTWIYNFAAENNQTPANFPVAGTDQPVHVNCYVWRPGVGKVGTILDGNTASTVDQAGNGIKAAHHVTFSGSAVASMENNDVIIIEIWFIVTPSTLGRTGSFYYDGTTENTTDNDIVSNHASFLETPEDLILEPPFTLFERAVSGTAEVDTAVARASTLLRSMTAEAEISDAIARIRTIPRSIIATAESASTVARLLFANRTIAAEAEVSAAVARIRTVLRSITTETVEVSSATVARMLTAIRSIAATAEVASAVVREHTVGLLFERPVAATVEVSAAVARIRSLLRSLSENFNING